MILGNLLCVLPGPDHKDFGLLLVRGESFVVGRGCWCLPAVIKESGPQGISFLALLARSRTLDARSCHRKTVEGVTWNMKHQAPLLPERPGCLGEVGGMLNGLPEQQMGGGIMLVPWDFRLPLAACQCSLLEAAGMQAHLGMLQGAGRFEPKGL